RSILADEIEVDIVMAHAQIQLGIDTRDPLQGTEAPAGRVARLELERGDLVWRPRKQPRDQIGVAVVPFLPALEELAIDRGRTPGDEITHDAALGIEERVGASAITADLARRGAIVSMSAASIIDSEVEPGGIVAHGKGQSETEILGFFLRLPLLGRVAPAAD